MNLQFLIRFLAAGAMIAFIFCAALPLISAESEQDASVQIANASQALNGAFIKVSEAERDNLNVSSLIDRLNTAGSILTSAQGALDEGNYTGAVSQAVSVISFANGIALDATGMIDQAAAQPSMLLVSVLFTLVGSVVLVAVLFLVWRRFKPYYIQRLLRDNPRLSNSCGL